VEKMEKLTDNEIKKALECCGKNTCRECLYNISDDRFDLTCTTNMAKDALGLINRQQAEIERLSNSAKQWEDTAKDLFIGKQTAKAEAIKEFAERMNAEAEKVEIDREGDFVEADFKIYDTVANWCKSTSNNLLKEKVGE
jgi:hypothetical protein